MAGRRTAISVGIDQILDMADRVGQLNAEDLGAAAVTSLNEVIDKTYDLSRERITTGINLTDDYLRRRMTVRHATEGKLEAEIVASGDRAFMTRLATYDASMVIVPRKTTRPSRAKGLLPVPTGVGAKQGGVRVSVIRGAPKLSTNMFLLPLRAGSALGEKFGVFKRENGRLKHLFGPSVYQLFAYQTERIVDDVADDLQQTLLEKVEDQLEKILK
ncbi:phage tail protein [Comamonas antarctica]|uniref:phage tail protein n=1 Tax=Comamonas antarctica TaxID=2743470 RepID=UPI0028EC3184|nr:phage tail protein [Comamonas antarctica]